MENLMIKAIRQFHKDHPKSEIRNVHAYESTGRHGKTVSALFHIEYVDDPEGEYKETYYRSNKEGSEED